MHNYGSPEPIPERTRARNLAAEYRRRRPSLSHALRADARTFAAHRGEPFHITTSSADWLNVARLLVISNDYAGLAMYRVRTALQRANVPVIPRFLGKVSASFFNTRISDDVLIEAGVYINHGHVVIDGVTSIGTGSVVAAWATLLPRAGEQIGPTIAPGAFIGTQAAVIGDVHVGHAAQVGAGAIVTRDVAARTIVAGNPARVLAENVPGLLELARRPEVPE
jgi:serine O-acetyltransferase